MKKLSSWKDVNLSCSLMIAWLLFCSQKITVIISCVFAQNQRTLILDVSERYKWSFFLTFCQSYFSFLLYFKTTVGVCYTRLMCTTVRSKVNGDFLWARKYEAWNDVMNDGSERVWQKKFWANAYLKQTSVCAYVIAIFIEIKFKLLWNISSKYWIINNKYLKTFDDFVSIHI